MSDAEAENATDRAGDVRADPAPGGSAATDPAPADRTPPGGEAGDPAEVHPARASEAMIYDALGECYDPELGIDIVALGLVYDVDLDDTGQLTIDMTLTSPYCPLGSVIQTQAHAVCMPLPGVESVRVNLVWSPPWDPRTMASDEARLMLGIY